jgi:predicted permease
MSLRDWFWRRRLEDDFDEEIRSHLHMAAIDRMRDGQEAETARLSALKEFGNVTLTREAARATWGGRWRESLASVARDVAYSVRLLTRAPGFSLTVVLVLAIGIAANTIVLLIAKGLFLRPLPAVPESASLNVVVSRSTGGKIGGMSYPDYRYVREHDGGFSGLAATSMQPYSLGVGTHAERVWGEAVSGNYFDVLGVRPSLGRPLLPSDEVAPGRHPVVVISDRLWKRAYGADRTIVGTKVLLNANPMTIVGVAPPGFQGTIVSLVMDVFVPVMMQRDLDRSTRLYADGGVRASTFLWGLGRPTSGTTLASVRAQTEILGQQLAANEPIDDVSERATLLPLWRSPFGAQTYMLPAVALLGAMGALLLLIVCANVANLVLVRGIGRRGEVAVRRALGASEIQILRLLFIENLALAVPGAVAGVTMAAIALPMFMSRTASAAPMRVNLDLSADGQTVVFALIVAAFSAVLFGFLPALRLSRADLASTMKDELSPRGTGRGRMRAALVAGQVAVSLMLLVGAALVMRSLDAARRADTGFNARNVGSMAIDLQSSGYDEERGRVFYQRLLDVLREDAGVESATLAVVLPMTLVDNASRAFAVERYEPRKDEDMRFLFNIVASDYFRTLRIGLVAGRDFEQRDDRSGLPVAIVNETLARRFWTTPASALGRRLRTGGGEWRTVVGVVRDIKYARVDEEPRPHVYLPFWQQYVPAMTIHVRARDSEQKPLEHLRDRLQTLDANVPILDSRMLAEQTRAALSIFEMAARWLLIFGLVAAGLAALGLYGLVSYTVKQSTHEIGIRMALGARWSDVVGRFVGRGLQLGAIGAGIGVIASLAVTRAMAAVLYGVGPTDLPSFAGAALIVLSVAIAASSVPAWLASRINPVTALRQR